MVSSSLGWRLYGLGGGGCPEERAKWWHWPPRLSASSLFQCSFEPEVWARRQRGSRGGWERERQ